MRRVLVGVVIGVALGAAAVAGGATVVNWPASCTKMACVNQHLNDVHALAHRADTRALLPGPKGDTGPAGKFTSVEIVTGTFSVPPAARFSPTSRSPARSARPSVAASRRSPPPEARCRPSPRA